MTVRWLTPGAGLPLPPWGATGGIRSVADVLTMRGPARRWHRLAVDVSIGPLPPGSWPSCSGRDSPSLTDYLMAAAHLPVLALRRRAPIAVWLVAIALAGALGVHLK